VRELGTPTAEFPSFKHDAVCDCVNTMAARPAILEGTSSPDPLVPFYILSILYEVDM